MSKEWRELLPEIQRIILRDGWRTVSGEIPAGRATVYRLLSGKVDEPSLALRKGVERLVEKRAAQGGDSNGPGIQGDAN